MKCIEEIIIVHIIQIGKTPKEGSEKIFEYRRDQNEPYKVIINDNKILDLTYSWEKYDIATLDGISDITINTASEMPYAIYNTSLKDIKKDHDEKLCKKIQNSKFGKNFIELFDSFFKKNPQIKPFENFEK